MKFRKKPVVIEAVTVECIYAAAEEKWNGPTRLPQWVVDAVQERTITFVGGNKLEVATLEGLHRADPSDWVIRGVKGELYPCKPDIFDMTYEPAEG